MVKSSPFHGEDYGFDPVHGTLLFTRVVEETEVPRSVDRHKGNHALAGNSM